MQKLNFENSLKKLQEIVLKLESESISLDEALDLFKEGIELTKACQTKLNSVEEQIVKIVKEEAIDDFVISDK